MISGGAISSGPIATFGALNNWPSPPPLDTATAVLDPSSPYVSNPVHAFLMAEASSAGVRDLVTGLDATTSGVVTIDSTLAGDAYRAMNANGFAPASSVDDLTDQATWVFIGTTKIFSFDGFFGHLFSQHPAWFLTNQDYSGGQPTRISIEAGGVEHSVNFNDGGESGETGIIHVYVATYDGVTLRTYQDGVPIASAAVTGSLTGQDDTHTRIGSYWDVTDGSLVGAREMVLPMLFRRAWQLEEIQSVSTYPWQLFAPPSDGETGDWSAAATAAAAFAAIVTLAPTAFSAAGSAGFSTNTLAQVTGALVAAGSAGDTPSSTGATTALLAAAGNVTGIMAGLSQAAAALVAGATAGEQWAAHVEALGELVAGGTAAAVFDSTPTYTAAIDESTAAALVLQAQVTTTALLSAGTTAAAGFRSAISLEGDLTASANAQAVVIGMATALAAIGGAGTATAGFEVTAITWRAMLAAAATAIAVFENTVGLQGRFVGAGLAAAVFDVTNRPGGDLVAALSSDALFYGGANGRGVISASLVAQAVFAASIIIPPGVLLGSLRIVAALNASVAAAPTLTASISISRALP